MWEEQRGGGEEEKTIIQKVTTLFFIFGIFCIELHFIRLTLTCKLFDRLTIGASLFSEEIAQQRRQSRVNQRQNNSYFPTRGELSFSSV